MLYVSTFEHLSSYLLAEKILNFVCLFLLQVDQPKITVISHKQDKKISTLTSTSILNYCLLNMNPTHHKKMNISENQQWTHESSFWSVYFSVSGWSSVYTNFFFSSECALRHVACSVFWYRVISLWPPLPTHTLPPRLNSHVVNGLN